VPVVGDLVAERYELEELVGSGGMSRVFRAHDRLLDRQVALKILHEQYLSDEEYVERFRREARAAAQLGHPNIVTVIDRGRSDGCEYIVFEYVEGENLKQLIERTGPLPVRRALELGIQIGRALEFAHTNGLVHRDVKPQNVLLGNGRAKVTDFGIARTVDVHGLTQTGTVLGTSDYIAPEQAQGLGASEQSDVYSLGVVLYELLTGAPPFTGEGFLQVALRHVHEPVPSVLEHRPDVPPRVAAAIDRALEKDPARRFPSMADFVAELRACVDGPGDTDGREATAIMPSGARPARAPAAVARRRRRPGAAVVLLVCGLLAAAASAGIYFASRGGNPAPSVAGGGGPASAAAANLKLQAVTAYDPEGDGGEHNDAAHLATDGDNSTYWETEHYSSQDFGGLKSGVGLVIDAGKAVKLAKLGVATDTPGFSAIVRAGASQQGPFTDVSSSQTVSGAAVYTLRVSSPERYYLLWITRLASGARAHVNEVSTGALTAPAPASAAPSPPPPPSPPAHGRGKGKGKKHEG
jgi:tRNA A-37 threonylcarbamoyl transferase component Bud32